jgi:hypothetical protein
LVVLLVVLLLLLLLFLLLLGLIVGILRRLDGVLDLPGALEREKRRRQQGGDEDGNTRRKTGHRNLLFESCGPEENLTPTGGGSYRVSTALKENSIHGCLRQFSKKWNIFAGCCGGPGILQRNAGFLDSALRASLAQIRAPWPGQP